MQTALNQKPSCLLKGSLAFFIGKGWGKIRLGIKAFYISIVILQIVLLVVSIETQADISLVKRVTVVPGGGPAGLTNVNGTLFFTADDGLYGRELWGSSLGLGAYLIKDIRTLPGYPELSSDPQSLTAMGGTLFFAATAADGTARELWKSNGTEDGTVMVKDINPLSDSSPRNLANVNGTLYFSADDGVHGHELWKSDGTSVGTVMAKDIETYPGAGSNPGGFTDVNGTFYFVAEAYELWKIHENEERFPWELFVPAFIEKHRP